MHSIIIVSIQLPNDLRIYDWHTKVCNHETVQLMQLAIRGFIGIVATTQPTKAMFSRYYSNDVVLSRRPKRHGQLKTPMQEQHKSTYMYSVYADAARFSLLSSIQHSKQPRLSENGGNRP